MRQNRFVLSLFVIISFALAYSCHNDTLKEVNRTADAIEGTYNLIAIEWEGNPVDINGDGITSINLYPELLSLPTNKQCFEAVVMDFSADRTYGSIGMHLPMQNVCVTYDGRFPKGWMTGNRFEVVISYHIDLDGNLSVDHFDSLNMPKDDSRIEMIRINNGTVFFDKKGMMSFRVGYTLYDLASDGLVDGIITYFFERVNQ